MTTAEFNSLTEPWKGKFPRLAVMLGKTQDQIKKYRTGKCRIPEDVAQAVSNIPEPPQKAPKPQKPAKMSVDTFRELSQKWGSFRLSQLLNIPKGTIDSYKSGKGRKNVSRLAEERIKILVAADEAGEDIENLFQQNALQSKMRLKRRKVVCPDF